MFKVCAELQISDISLIMNLDENVSNDKNLQHIKCALSLEG